MHLDTLEQSICVFAPAPLLTITVERDPEEVHIHAGGQGVWVARMVAGLGARPILCTALGGETGEVIRSLLDEPIGLRAVTASAPSGAYLHDRTGGERREVWRSHLGRLGRHEQDALQDELLACMDDATVCVLTGVPPGEEVVEPDLYRRLVTDLHAAGLPVVADVSGPILDAVLGAGVDVLKVSADELVRDGMAPDTEPASVTIALEELHERGAGQVVISRAEDGAFALVGDTVLHVVPPQLVTVDPHGAGDSMTAGLAVGLARQMHPSAMLRLAVSAGAVNAAHHGLGTGTRAAVEALAARATVEAHHEVRQS
jgi:1-phosphofructokinase